MKDILIKIKQNKKIENENELNELASFTLDLRKIYKEKNESSNIKVRDLFWKSNFEKVWEILESEYSAENKEFYKKIFNNILKQKDSLSENNHFLGFNELFKSTDTSFYYNHGVVNYGIALTKYNELANLFVTKYTLDNYEINEIVAGFIDEFSWDADDESKEAFEEKLNERIFEIEENVKDEENKNKILNFPIDKIDKKNNINNNKSNNILDFKELKKELYFDLDDLDDFDEEFEDDFEEELESPDDMKILDFYKELSYKDVKEEFIFLCDDLIERGYILKLEDLESFFDNNYLTLLSEIKLNKPNDYFEHVTLDFENHFFKGYSGDKRAGYIKNINSIYNGKSTLDVVHFKLNASFQTKEEIIASLFFAYFDYELVDTVFYHSLFKEETYLLSHNIELNKTFESALLKNFSLRELNFSELKTLSYLIENYFNYNHDQLKKFDELKVD